MECTGDLALAIAIAAGAKATGADSLIAKAFSGSPLRATLIAAMVGAIAHADVVTGPRLHATTYVTVWPAAMSNTRTPVALPSPSLTGWP